MMQSLKDIAIIAAGQGAPQGDENYCDHGTPFVKAGNLSELLEGKSIEAIQKVSSEVANQYKLKLYPRGTILFAKSGMSCMKGYVYKLPRPAYVVNHLACIIPHGNTSDYLQHYFEYYKPNRLIKDNAYPSISLTDIGNLKIDLKTEEQRASVVSVLDKTKTIIRLRRQQLKKLDDLIKARFVEMFGDNESNPMKWKQCSIGDCCTLKSGTSLPADVENEGGSIPYVKVGDMNYPGNEKYITTSSRFVTQTTAGNGIFKIGSILFPKRGGAINTNKKRMTKLPICADLNIMGVSSNGQLLPEYLFTYFDLIDLGALADGSSVPQINNKNIAPLPICIPPMELQSQFASFVVTTDTVKTSIQHSLGRTQLLFDSLMRQSFG